MVVFGIYLVVTICLLAATERIERLDSDNFRNSIFAKKCNDNLVLSEVPALCVWRGTTFV